MTLVPMVPVVALVLLTLATVLALVVMGRTALRPGADPGSRSRLARRAALAALALLVLAGPSVRATATSPVSNVEVYLYVDRTGSMAAEDFDGTTPRLDAVRADLLAIRDAFPQARLSVIALDSSAARELPLTSDLGAYTAWVGALRQELTDQSSGSSLERGLPLLATTLARAAEKDPQDVRLLYVLSDGEATDDGEGASQAQAQGLSWEGLGAFVDGGAVLGYGTPEGGRMREYDGSPGSGAGSDAPYITDSATGQEGVSVIDEEELTSVAAALGVPYVHRTSAGQTESFTQVDVRQVLTDGRLDKVASRYVVWPAGLAVAALLGWELIDLALTDRRLSRLVPAPRRTE